VSALLAAIFAGGFVLQTIQWWRAYRGWKRALDGWDRANKRCDEWRELNDKTLAEWRAQLAVADSIRARSKREDLWN
jgi:hypothetical protein